MGLKAAICTQCGAQLQVDDTKDACICDYCGTPFITEKAINNYNNNYSISNATINVYGDAQRFNQENLLKMARNAQQSGNYIEAVNYYNKVLEYDPDNLVVLFEKGCALFMSDTIRYDSSKLLYYCDIVFKQLSKENIISYIDILLSYCKIASKIIYNNYSENNNWMNGKNFTIFVDGLRECHKVSDYAITYFENNSLIYLNKLSYTSWLKYDCELLVELCKKRKCIVTVNNVERRSAPVQLLPNERVYLFNDYKKKKAKYIELTGKSKDIPKIEKPSFMDTF